MCSYVTCSIVPIAPFIILRCRDKECVITKTKAGPTKRFVSRFVNWPNLNDFDVFVT